MTTIECQKITRQIVDKLRSEYSPLKIILFGSYANGTYKADSDIDLLIIEDTNGRFIDRWVAVRKILSDSSRKIGIETFVITPQEISNRLALGDQFIAEIIEKGQILYTSLGVG